MAHAEATNKVVEMHERNNMHLVQRLTMLTERTHELEQVCKSYHAGMDWFFDVGSDEDEADVDAWNAWTKRMEILQARASVVLEREDK